MRFNRRHVGLYATAIGFAFFFSGITLHAQTAPNVQRPNVTRPNTGIRTQGVDTRSGTNLMPPDQVQPNLTPDSRGFTGAPGPNGELPIRPGAAVNDRATARVATTATAAPGSGTRSGAGAARGVLPEGGVPNAGTHGAARTRPAENPPQPQPQKPPQMVPHTAGAPFTLTPVQEADLNRFLEDWEKVSATYKRFECKFYCFTYGVAFTEGKTDKLEKDIPDYVTYGWLRYSAPNRGAYEVTGEVTGSANNRIEVDFDKKAKRADEHIDGRRVKYLSTGEEIHNFDFADSKVYIYRVPKDQQTGIATGGPMPLVFGAKAADLRKRYYLRLVTPESSVKRNEIWLEAYPRNEDDAAEFKCVHLVVDRKERIPKAFIKYSVNGTQRDVYEFDISSLKINSRWDTLMEATFFDPNRVPGNWTKVNIETPPEAAAPQQRGVAQGNPQQRPGNVPAPKNVAPNRPIGTQVTGTPQNQRPPQNRVQAPKSEEIELYTPPETKGRPTF